MLTTPNYGLEYAEGDDPAKSYPAVVDGPSKLKIDSALKAQADILTKLGLSGRKVQYGSTVVAMGGPQSSVNYSVAFAAKPVVLAMIGDTTGTAMTVRLVDASCTAGQFVFQLLNEAGAVLTTGSYRINWVAIGTAV